MKYVRNIFLSVLSCILLCLTGCGSNEKALVSASSQNQQVSQSVSTADEKETESTTDSPVEYRLISSPGGIIYTGPAVTDAGFYEIVYAKDVVSGAGNIVYTDFDTRRRVYLSSDLTGDHQSAEDSSYLPSLIGGAGIITDDQYVYVVKLGTSYLAGEYGERGVPCLYRMETNGQNRCTIPLSANQNINDSSGIVSDGKYLYFIASTITSNNTHIALLQANFEEGTLLELMSLDDLSQGNSLFSIVGAHDDKILLSGIKYDTETQQSGWTFFECSPRANHVEQVLSVDSASQYPIYRKGLIYVLDLQDGTMDLLEPNEKKLVRVLDNVIPDTIVIDQIEAGIGAFWPYFPFLYTDTKQDVSYRYCWNEENGEWTQERLEKDGRIIYLVGAYQDKLLVHLGDKEVFYQDYAEDGTGFQNSMLTPEYALINKSDYWAGIPNYIYFEDSIY